MCRGMAPMMAYELECIGARLRWGKEGRIFLFSKPVTLIADALAS